MSRRPVAIGAAAWVAAAAWTFVSSAISGGNPWPTVGVIAAAGGSFAAAWTLGRIKRWAAPGAVLVAAGSLALRFDVASRRPTGGPFGYVNATGAFYLLGAFAGLMIAAASERAAVRATGVIGAIACATVPFAGGSVAAALLSVAVPAIALVLTAVWSARAAIAVLAGLTAATFVGSIALGATYPHASRAGGFARAVTTALTDRRVVLWSEALDLTASRPVAGVGPGRFAFESPTALEDRDARWAHNGFLQQGAETGVPGLVLMLLIFTWTFAVVSRSRPDTFAVLGAAAIAAIGIAACIDYIFHFPAIPVAAAALAGAAASPRSKSIDPETGGI